MNFTSVKDFVKILLQTLRHKSFQMHRILELGNLFLKTIFKYSFYYKDK